VKVKRARANPAFTHADARFHNLFTNSDPIILLERELQGGIGEMNYRAER
jgi:hypothetical protein